MAEPFKLAFTDPEELEARIEEYFESRWATRTIKQIVQGQAQTWEEEYMRPPTMAGLARHLGVVRATLWQYAHRDSTADLFKPVITRALNRMAEFAEEATYTREGHQGGRFALEVNHRYGREEDHQGPPPGAEPKALPPAGPEALAVTKWEDIEEDDGD